MNLSSNNPIQEDNLNREVNLNQELEELLALLPTLPNRESISQVLNLILELSKTNILPFDWKLIAKTLQDLGKASEIFRPYRHARKVSIFGSARIDENSLEYAQAKEFAHQITKAGFMVLTGGGGGIMAAGNEGAGSESSFGLNIELPYEHAPNPHISRQNYLDFNYFFTRKLFFLRETHAIVIFPGGFGTQDELFETLTLMQTGKCAPIPLILIDKPNGCYWQEWDGYIQSCLLGRELIASEDRNFYKITSDIKEAAALIVNFYKNYHSSFWAQDSFVMRLNREISDIHLRRLNHLFRDCLIDGEIVRGDDFSPKLKKSKMELPKIDESEDNSLPKLAMRLKHHSYGDLHRLIEAINDDSEFSPTIPWSKSN